jgi:hypothetical protein
MARRPIGSRVSLNYDLTLCRVTLSSSDDSRIARTHRLKAFFPRPRSFTGLARRSYRSKEPPATRAVPHSTTLVACSPIVVAKTARSTTVARQLRICSGSRASVPVLNISRGLSAGLLPEAKRIELFVTIVRRSWICASFLIISSTFAVAPPEKPLWASWAAHLCVMTVSAAVSPGWIV